MNYIFNEWQDLTTQAGMQKEEVFMEESRVAHRNKQYMSPKDERLVELAMRVGEHSSLSGQLLEKQQELVDARRKICEYDGLKFCLTKEVAYWKGEWEKALDELEALHDKYNKLVEKTKKKPVKKVTKGKK